MTHYTDEDLTLYYYGEGRRRAEIEQHLDACAACTATYREIAGTLAMVAAPEVPERGDQYGLEVWQRIRHQLPEQESSAWAALTGFFRPDRRVLAAAAATLLIGAFVAGRIWPRQPAVALAPAASQTASASASAGESRQRSGGNEALNGARLSRAAAARRAVV